MQFFTQLQLIVAPKMNGQRNEIHKFVSVDWNVKCKIIYFFRDAHREIREFLKFFAQRQNVWNAKSWALHGRIVKINRFDSQTKFKNLVGFVPDITEDVSYKRIFYRKCASEFSEYLVLPMNLFVILFSISLCKKSKVNRPIFKEFMTMSRCLFRLFCFFFLSICNWCSFFIYCELWVVRK